MVVTDMIMMRTKDSMDKYAMEDATYDFIIKHLEVAFVNEMFVMELLRGYQYSVDNAN